MIMAETKTLYAAMAKAFAAMEGASKYANNPHFKTKYADLSSVVDAIKPALTANELWFRQATHEQAGGVCIETLVCHSSGEEISFGKLFLPASKQDAQGYGSALTYARRYSLMTAFGICPEDDDGNAARPADKPATIDSGQISDLQGMIEGFGLNLGKILQHYKITSFKEIPADEFGNVTAQINRWNDAAIAKREAAQQETQNA
jgi:hypothetical protein